MWWARLLNNISGFLGGATPIIGDYESIATTIVGSGGQAAITFSVIPSTYKHLQIRAMAQSTTTNQIDMTFNSDTGNNYAGHSLEGSGSGTPSAAAGPTRANMFSMVYVPGTSNSPAASIIDILDYQNTNKYKVARALRGWDNNSSGNIGSISGLWMNTNAITSITLTARGGTIDQYSHFALYGMKG
jgi:hypothetical protein